MTNPNPFSQKIKIYTASAAVLITLSVLMRVACMLWCFDTDPGYFRDSLPVTISHVLCILCALWLLSGILLVPRYAYPLKTRPQTTHATRIGALLCGVAIAGSAYFFYQTRLFYPTQARSYLLIAALSLLACLYFLLHYLEHKNTHHAALAAYALILWSAAVLSTAYLNLYVPMNSPLKVAMLMAYLSIMLFTMEDARLLTDHDFRSAYFFSALLSVLLCTFFAVPTIIAFVAGVLWDIDYLAYAILALTFSVHAATRAHACYRALMTAPAMTEQEIADDRRKRKEEKEKRSGKQRAETTAQAPDQNDPPSNT